jgi:hypothetical protein
MELGFRVAAVYEALSLKLLVLLVYHSMTATRALLCLTCTCNMRCRPTPERGLKLLVYEALSY